MRRILGGKYIAVCDDRNIDGFFHLADDIPVRTAGVHLRSRSAVHGYRGSPRLLHYLCKLHGIDTSAVKSLSELDRNGDIDARHHRLYYFPGKLRIAHERRAVAAFDDLTHRAAHIYIQHIRAGIFDRHRRRLCHYLRLVAEYLCGEGSAAGQIIKQAFCLIIAVAQRLRTDHLGRRECGAKLGAYRTERKIRDPCHWRKRQQAVNLNIAYLHHNISSPTGQ